MGAGLQQNTWKEWGLAVWSKMTKISPIPSFRRRRFTGTGHGWSNSYKSSKKFIGGSLGKLHSSRSCRQQGLASTPRNCIRVFALLLCNSTSYAITDNIMMFTYRGTEFLVMNINDVQIPTYRHHLHSTPYLATTHPTVLISVPYSGKFSRVLIFAVFADQGETAKFYPAKIFNLLLYV